MYRAISRLALAGTLSAVLVAVCSRLPHLNDATAALLMVLCVLGISIKWGWAEALAAAIVGGSCFDYYFLGPPGFAITGVRGKPCCISDYRYHNGSTGRAVKAAPNRGRPANK